MLTSWAVNSNLTSMLVLETAPAHINPGFQDFNASYRLTGQITHEHYLGMISRRNSANNVYWMPPSEGERDVSQPMEMWSCLIVSNSHILQLTLVSDVWGWDASDAQEWHLSSHLHRAPHWSWDCRGIITARSCFRDRTPYQGRALQTSDRVSLPTTTLERKRGETYLALSGLAPSPR